MNRFRGILPAEVIVPTVIVIVLSVISAMGFRGVFPDWTFASAALIGAFGAAGIMLLTKWARLVTGEALLLSFIGFVFLGAIAVGGIPTPDSFRTFFDGLIKGWAQVLSSTPPADLTPQFRVLPYTIAWGGSMLGTELARSTRIPAIPSLGPILALAVSLLVTIEDHTVALFQGAAMVVGAVLMGAVQLRLMSAGETDAVHVGSSHRSRGLTVAGIGLVLIAAAAPALGPHMPLANANQRFNLRRYQSSQFDPLLEPSPLAQIKASLQNETAGKVVFSATSRDGIQIARWPIAVGRTYDGVTWAVANENRDAAGEFRPVDSIFPKPSVDTLDRWTTVTSEIVIVDYSNLAAGRIKNVWLPSPGWPEKLTSDQPLDIRFNRITGTMALPPNGPATGLAYTVTAAIPPEGTAVEVRDARLADGTGATGDQLSPAMRSYSADILEGKDVGWSQVEAIQAKLQDGFYDAQRGNPESRSGHSSFRLNDFVHNPERIVGFEEQYAATAALIARANGIPARVVVGYRIPDDELAGRWAGGRIDVFAGDMSAWIEVDFDGFGWLPFDVTPPRNRNPQVLQTGVTERQVAAPNPPQPPPPPSLSPQVKQSQDIEKLKQVDKPKESGGTGGGIPLRLIAPGAAVAGPVLLLLLLAVVVSTLKSKRSRRRRHLGSPSRRVAGAWQETVDRLGEDGVHVPLTATPMELADGLVAQHHLAADLLPAVRSLASEVSRAAYHPEPAAEDQADRAWKNSDEVIRSVLAHRGRLTKLRVRFDPRPLMRTDPTREPEESRA